LKKNVDPDDTLFLSVIMKILVEFKIRQAEKIIIALEIGFVVACRLEESHTFIASNKIKSRFS
jgi:hypothetical protein